MNSPTPVIIFKIKLTKFSTSATYLVAQICVATIQGYNKYKLFVLFHDESMVLFICQDIQYGSNLNSPENNSVLFFHSTSAL